jgi:hypothetical protein
MASLRHPDSSSGNDVFAKKHLIIAQIIGFSYKTSIIPEEESGQALKPAVSTAGMLKKLLLHLSSFQKHHI